MPSACASEPARSIGGTSMATSPQRALQLYRTGPVTGSGATRSSAARRSRASIGGSGKRVLANRYHTPHHLHGLRPAHHNRHKPTTAQTSRLRRPLVRTGIQPSLSEVLGLVDVDARPHLGEGCERGAAAQIKLLQRDERGQRGEGRQRAAAERRARRRMVDGGERERD